MDSNVGSEGGTDSDVVAHQGAVLHNQVHRRGVRLNAIACVSRRVQVVDRQMGVVNRMEPVAAHCVDVNVVESPGDGADGSLRPYAHGAIRDSNVLEEYLCALRLSDVD